VPPPPPPRGAPPSQVIQISVERVLALYAKRGEEGEHYLVGRVRRRQPDLSAVVVIDGEQRRTPTARNCRDVRPRLLLGAVDADPEAGGGPASAPTLFSQPGAAPALAAPVVHCLGRWTGRWTGRGLRVYIYIVVQRSLLQYLTFQAHYSHNIGDPLKGTRRTTINFSASGARLWQMLAVGVVIGGRGSITV
jgi:hypothetical protein